MRASQRTVASFAVGRGMVFLFGVMTVVDAAVEKRIGYDDCVGTKRSNCISARRKVLRTTGKGEDPGKHDSTQLLATDSQHWLLHRVAQFDQKLVNVTVNANAMV